MALGTFPRLCSVYPCLRAVIFPGGVVAFPKREVSYNIMGLMKLGCNGYYYPFFHT
jgi:hypothetical protein